MVLEGRSRCNLSSTAKQSDPRRGIHHQSECFENRGASNHYGILQETTEDGTEKVYS